MTLEDLKDLIADLAKTQAETDRLLKEQALEFKEQALEFKEQAREASRRSAETDRQIRTLRKEIGALGEKFGGFTEGMAFHALKKILEERFHMNVVAPRVHAHHGEDSVEFDMLAYANSGVNAVCAVEVKSRLRRRDIRRLESKLNDLERFLPIHHGKKAYGILAAVDFTEDQRQEVLDSGFYLAHINDEAFQLDVPEDFTPRTFQI